MSLSMTRNVPKDRPRQLADFVGSWTMSREIDDARAGPHLGPHAGGQKAHLEGHCQFLSDPGGVLQVERGLLSLPGVAQPFEASRSYLWRTEGAERTLERARISVYFEDGRFFHEFDPNEDHPEAGHDCAPDRYDVRYDFSEWPEWRVRWRVVGPRKDYVSVTTYRRP